MAEKKTADKIEEILALMREGVPVYTVNTRLSRYLTAEYDSMMKAAGRGAWPSAEVMSVDAWFEVLWNSAVPESPVLAPASARVLWARVVDADISKRDNGLLLPKGAAQTAYRAYELLADYKLRLPKDELYLTEEAKAMKRWAGAYWKELGSLGFVDRPGLSGRLAPLILEGRVKLKEKLILAGFDELTPLVRGVVSALSERGTKVLFWPRAPGKSREVVDIAPHAGVEIYDFVDEGAEVRGAARWVRSVASPDTRVGIVVPELERYRALIEREFAFELDPASALVEGGRKEGVFNISLGTSLYEEPLVRSALEILSIGNGRVRIEEMMGALRSPFFSPPSEYLVLSRIDAALREENRARTALHTVAERVKRHGANSLAKRLESWKKALSGMRGTRLPGAWAAAFSGLLKELGWLAPVELSSTEYQAKDAWRALLERFSALDDITGPLERAPALALLEDAARDTVHQPKTPESGVQVLGLLESTGQSFDHLWIMGCHENAFPSTPSPNPFIPLYMQREAGVSRATAEGELAFAKLVLDRLFSSAPSVRVSWAKRAGSREQRPSPLLRQLLRKHGTRCVSPEPTGESGSSRLVDTVHATYDPLTAHPLLEIPAEGPLPVEPEELATLSGGTLIIKNQSLCPFKAFATHRLGARALATPTPGLSPAERGSILHGALKLFWEGVEDSVRLNRIIERGELDGYIDGICTAAFASTLKKRPEEPRFMEMEKERLASIIRDWIEVEAERGPFRVKKVEVPSAIEIAGLKVVEQPDRIDELEDGSSVVIDYKSGVSARSDWLTGRPRDPQLLVYSINGRYDAVSFARLRPGECRFIGISRDDGRLPGVKALENDRWARYTGVEGGWDALMAYWQRVVETLAQEFMEGHNEVDPVEEPGSGKAPCTYCELTAFCRISEARAGRGTGTDAEDEQGSEGEDGG